MSSRRIAAEELPELLRLYTFLHPEDPVVDPGSVSVREIWTQILRDSNLRYYVFEEQKQIVTTCALTLIPNLTRGVRPYGLIENVVTDPNFRNRGFATQLLRYVLNDAWRARCYKVMLETGSKKEDTLRFYEKAGFKRGVKTGFIAYPDQKTG